MTAEQRLADTQAHLVGLPTGATPQPGGPLYFVLPTPRRCRVSSLPSVLTNCRHPSWYS